MAGKQANTKGADAPGAAASPAANNSGVTSFGDEAAAEAAVAAILDAEPERADDDEPETPEGAATDEVDDAGGEEPGETPEADTGSDEPGEGEGDETDQGDDSAQPEGDEAGGEAEGSPDESATTEDDDAKVPKGLQRRFAELTKTVHELKAQNDTLAQRLQQNQQQPRPVAQPTQLLAKVLTAGSEQELQAALEQAQKMEDWAVAHATGAELPAQTEGGEPTHIPAEAVAQVLQEARQAQRLIPQRDQFIKARKGCDGEALKAHPDYGNPESKLSQVYAQVAAALPEAVHRVPQLKMIVGDAWAYQQIRERKAKEEAQKGKSVGKPVQKPQHTPPAMAASAARKPAPAGKDQKVKALRDRAEKTGSEDDVANLISARFG